MVTGNLAVTKSPFVSTTVPGGESLVERAKEGEAQAFLQLFQEHGSRIYSLSLHATRNVAAAESLTREIFLDVFSTLDAVGDEGDFAVRLYRNAAQTLLRWPEHASPAETTSPVTATDANIHLTDFSLMDQKTGG